VDANTSYTPVLHIFAYVARHIQAYQLLSTLNLEIWSGLQTNGTKELNFRYYELQNW
ncbi:6792_t:CDS:1, partial [Rhizophagus irregularis]